MMFILFHRFLLWPKFWVCERHSALDEEDSDYYA